MANSHMIATNIGEDPSLERLKIEIAEILKDVKGRTFIVDLEDTLLCESADRRWVLDGNMAVVEVLAGNGNNVVFYTSAEKNEALDLKERLPDTLKGCHVADRQTTWLIMDAYAKIVKQSLDPLQIQDELNALEITQEGFMRGLDFFTNSSVGSLYLDLFGTADEIDPRFFKLFFVYGDPKEDFIFDNDMGLPSDPLVLNMGWDQKRIVHAGSTYEDALASAKKIAEAFIDITRR